jgi:hypothetical protein
MQSLFLVESRSSADPVGGTVCDGVMDMANCGLGYVEDAD